MPVSVNEIKKMYRKLSKNDLIRVVIKLPNENALLKMKQSDYKSLSEKKRAAIQKGKTIDSLYEENKVDVSGLKITQSGQVVNK